jgi:hypothetical protein
MDFQLLQAEQIFDRLRYKQMGIPNQNEKILLPWISIPVFIVAKGKKSTDGSEEGSGEKS